MSGYLERLLRRGLGPAAAGDPRADDALRPRPRTRFEGDPGGADEGLEAPEEVAVRPPPTGLAGSGEARPAKELGHDGSPHREPRAARAEARGAETSAPGRETAPATPPGPADTASADSISPPSPGAPPPRRRSAADQETRRGVTERRPRPPAPPVAATPTPAAETQAFPHVPMLHPEPRAPRLAGTPEPAPPDPPPPEPAADPGPPAVVEVREVRGADDHPAFDRRAVEATARALVERRFATGDPEPSGDRGPLVLASDGEPRIEVRIDRVEVVRRQAPAPDPVPVRARRPRPAPRGFANLAALRGHTRRGWS